eukprot:5269913-Amphidinium_carterae.1
MSSSIFVFKEDSASNAKEVSEVGTLLIPLCHGRSHPTKVLPLTEGWSDELGVSSQSVRKTVATELITIAIPKEKM